MDKVQEVVKNFHEINGTTIGERKRNLQMLINNIKQTNTITKEDLPNLNMLLTPKNKLEEIFKLIVFIQFKYTEYLFKIFESGKIHLINILLKEDWFFQEAFVNINGVKLVNELFLNISPITRIRIINKLNANLKNETISEDYFKTIFNKYGFDAANKILSSCSIDFIKNILNEYEVKFSERQLLRIVQKDTNFAQFYFDKFHHTQHYKISINDYKLVLRYIASNNFTLFISFLNRYEIIVKFNSKLTKRIYLVKKDDIIKRPIYYLNILNYDKLIRLLKDDLEEFYTNLLPKSLEEFGKTIEDPTEKYTLNSSTYKLIHHLPPNERYELFKKTFFKIYETDILENPKLVTKYLIEIMPQPERTNWAKLKFEGDMWICYLDSPESVPLIKEKLKLYSDRTIRCTYLKYLIETCRINKDEDALLDVLKFFVEKHRNEDSHNRMDFLEKLKSSFKIVRLTTEHWIEIKKILKLFVLNNENFYQMPSYSEDYLHHLYLCKKLNDDDISSFLKENFKDIYISGAIPKHLQLIIKRFPELIIRDFKDDEFEEACTTYITIVNDWNKILKHDKIDPYSYPKIVEVIIKKHDTGIKYFMYDVPFQCLVEWNSNCDQKQIVMGMFWEGVIYGCFYALPIINQTLKYDPLTIAKYADKISQIDLKKKCYISKLQLYSHLNLPEKFIEIHTNKLNDDEFTLKSIKALSYLLPTELYLNLMSQYHVKNTKIDFEDDHYTFKYQTAFVESLSNLDQYVLTLPHLQQFCAGDFLHVALKSLYSIINYLPEYETKDFLNILLNKSVSVRKHALYLIISTRDSETIYQTLKEFGEKETNSSLHKICFKKTFNYFCKNPSNKFWELLKNKAKLIKKEDEEAYECFQQLDLVPLKHLVNFIQFSWDNMNESVQVKKYSLLKHPAVTEEIVKLLPDSFCRNLLEKHLFDEIANSSALNEFCCKYLFSTENKSNLEFVFDLLKKHVNNNWKIATNGTSRQIVFLYLKHICNECRIKNKIDFLNKFATEWYTVMDIITAYEEHLIIQISIFFLNWQTENKIRNFAENVSNFYIENIQKYGNKIVNIFSNALKTILNECLKNFEGIREKHYFNFLINFINTNKTLEVYELVLYLLPEKYSMVKNIATQHQMILSEISKNPELQIQYNYYLKKIKSAKIPTS